MGNVYPADVSQLRSARVSHVSILTIVVLISRREADVRCYGDAMVSVSNQRTRTTNNSLVAATNDLVQ